MPISSYFITGEEKEEIEDCVNLCYLYGTQREKANTFFLKNIDKHKNSVEKLVWDYFYLEQSSFLEERYEDAGVYYKAAFESSVKSTTAAAYFIYLI